MEPPKDLPDDQLAVWRALAPHALRERTLTPERALAFQELCEAIAVKRAIFSDPTERGGTRYTKMAALITAGLARFRLHGDGKPVAAVEQPKDAFAEFDGPVLAKGAQTA